jgi:hypothetical protein
MTDHPIEIKIENNWKARALAAEAKLEELAAIADFAPDAQEVIQMAEWARTSIGSEEFTMRGLATLRALSKLDARDRGKVRQAVSLRLNVAEVKLQEIEQRIRNHPRDLVLANQGLTAWRRFKKYS